MTCTSCGLEEQDGRCKRCGEDPGRTYFAVLGVPEGAAMRSVQSAYKRQMRRFHPDMMNGAPEETRAEAEARTVQLNAIKETLTDPDRRAAYLRRLDETRTRRAAQRVAREQAAEKAAAAERARLEQAARAEAERAAAQAQREREEAARAEAARRQALADEVNQRLRAAAARRKHGVLRDACAIAGASLARAAKAVAVIASPARRRAREEGAD